MYVYITKVWDGIDGNYVYNKIIHRLWKNADILPTTWKVNINNEVGSASISEKVKVVSKKICTDLCQYMSDVELKAKEYSVYKTSPAGSAFNNSFVSDINFSSGDSECMVETWINIEDKTEVTDAMVDYESYITEISDTHLSYDFIDDEIEGDEEISIISVPKRKFTHLEAVKAMDLIQ